MKLRISTIVLAGLCALPAHAQFGGGSFGGGLGGLGGGLGGGILGGGGGIGGISGGMLGRLGMSGGRKAPAAVVVPQVQQNAPGQIMIPLYAPSLIIPNTNVLTFGGQAGQQPGQQAGASVALTGSEFAQIVNHMTPIVNALPQNQAQNPGVQGQPSQGQNSQQGGGGYVSQYQPGLASQNSPNQPAEHPFIEAGRRARAAAQLSTAPGRLAPQDQVPGPPQAAPRNQPPNQAPADLQLQAAQAQPTGPRSRAGMVRPGAQQQPGQDQNAVGPLLPDLSLQDIVPTSLDLQDISLGQAGQQPAGGQINVPRVGAAQVGAQRIGQQRNNPPAQQAPPPQQRRIRRSRQPGG